MAQDQMMYNPQYGQQQPANAFYGQQQPPVPLNNQQQPAYPPIGQQPQAPLDQQQGFPQQNPQQMVYPPAAPQLQQQGFPAGAQQQPAYTPSGLLQPPPYNPAYNGRSSQNPAPYGFQGQPAPFQGQQQSGGVIGYGTMSKGSTETSFTIRMAEPSSCDSRSDKSHRQDLEACSHKKHKHEDFTFDEVSVRAGFVRKVFSLLTLMLLIVVGMIALFMFEPNCKQFARGNLWPYFLAYGVFIVTYVAIMCCESVRRKYPGNIICLLLLTFAMGYMTAMISTFHDTNIILIALAICTLSCGSVMIFACQTKYDFTKWAGTVFVLFIVLFFFGIGSMIAMIHFQISYLYVIYSGLMALFFMMFLAIDTQMLIGGKRLEYSPEDFIAVTIQLFLDIVLVFLHILQFTGAISRSS